MRVCAFCHQPVSYTKLGTLAGCYVHASTGLFYCCDETGREHDCNTRTIPVLQWEPAGAELKRWWRRWRLIRKARTIDNPAPGVRIIREDWNDHGAA